MRAARCRLIHPTGYPSMAHGLCCLTLAAAAASLAACSLSRLRSVFFWVLFVFWGFCVVVFEFFWFCCVVVFFRNHFGAIIIPPSSCLRTKHCTIPPIHIYIPAPSHPFVSTYPMVSIHILKQRTPNLEVALQAYSSSKWRPSGVWKGWE